jgi:hypothetical protein
MPHIGISAGTTVAFDRKCRSIIKDGRRRGHVFSAFARFAAPNWKEERLRGASAMLAIAAHLACRGTIN